MTRDRQAIFRRWFGQHQGLIYRVVRAYGRTPEDREDLFQDICLQLWCSVSKFEGKAKVQTWIYRVALNTALVWNRAKKKRRRRRRVMLDLTDVADPRLDADSAHGDDEIVEQVYAAIRELPKVDSSLVLMCLDGLSYREMADVLGISQNHVGVKLNRARKKLARMLEGLIDDV